MNKVTWKRNPLSNTLEPYMFEETGNGQQWVNFRNSRCYNSTYSPFFKDESVGIDAFRTAIKLNYQVIQNSEI